MQGWISRPGYETTHEATIGSPGGLPGQPGDSERSPFAYHRVGQQMLPIQIARLRVEGCAPYLHERGLPQFRPDKLDTPETHAALLMASA
jgi:hypothetical protein